MLGLKLNIVNAARGADLEGAFATLSQLGAEGLVISTDAFLNTQSERLGKLSLRYRVPAIFQYREFVAADGLLGYGASLTELLFQVGIYTGRILKGEKPADLPIQEVTKLELFINLKTAKAFGLTVPTSLLATADEVIE